MPDPDLNPNANVNNDGTAVLEAGAEKLGMTGDGKVAAVDDDLIIDPADELNRRRAGGGDGGAGDGNDGAGGGEGDGNEVDDLVDDFSLDVGGGEEVIEEIDTSGMETKAAEAFAGMRKKITSLTTSLSERDTELTALRGKSPVDTAAHEQLAAQLKEAHDTIGMLSLERHPQFTAKFDRPMASMKENLKGVFKELGHDETQVDRVLGMSLKGRLDFLSQNIPEMQGALMPLFTEIDSLSRQRATALSDHQNQSGEIQQRMATQQAAQNAEVKDRLFTAAIEACDKEGHFAFKKTTKNENWNKNVDAMQARAKELLMGDNLEEQSKALVMGVAAPIYLEMYKLEREKRMALQNGDTRIRNRKPSVRSRSSGQPKQKARDRSKGMSAEDAAGMVADGLFKKK